MVVTEKFGADVNMTNDILNAFFARAVITRSPSNNSDVLQPTTGLKPGSSCTQLHLGLSTQLLTLWFPANWSMLNATDEKRQSPSPSIGCPVRHHKARLLSNFFDAPPAV